MELRDYQVEAVDKLSAGFRAGYKRQILCAPTGAGKTILAIDMIKKSMAKGKRIAFIADRISLIDQTSRVLWNENIEHGILQGDNTFGRSQKLQVCSAQTLEKRGFWNDFDFIIVDEAHTMRKQTIEMILTCDKPVIGLTATPFSKGLGKVYDNIINARTTEKLFDEGWLVRPRVFCATEIDMTGAKTVAGEWGNKEVENRAIPIVGDIVSEWQSHTQDLFGGAVKTLVFSPTIAYGAELCKQFNDAGFNFKQVTYQSDGANSIDEFRAGKIDGLISVEKLAKGFDVPDVLCLVNARPYRKSLAGHIQGLGRGLRPSPGKDFCLVMDHAGNYLRHAEATEKFWREGCFSLDDGKRKKKEKQDIPEDNSDRKCFECSYVLAPQDTKCGICGAERKRKMKKTLSSNVAGKMNEYRPLSKQADFLKFRGVNVWNNVCFLGMEKHPADFIKAKKFAMAQFRNLKGAWPPKGAVFSPAEFCVPEVRAEVDRAFAHWLNNQRKQGYKAKKYG